MTAQRYVVGYTATESGDDAVALGARLARATGAELDIVLVLPEEGRGAVVPPDAGYETFLRSRAEGWLAAGAARVAWSGVGAPRRRVGMPAARAAPIALALLPARCRAEAGGPTKVIPCRAHSSARSGFSERKP